MSVAVAVPQVARVESHGAGDHAVGCRVERFDGCRPVWDAAVVLGPITDDEPHDLSHAPVVEVVDKGDDGSWLIGGEVDDHVEALGGGHFNVVARQRLGE